MYEINDNYYWHKHGNVKDILNGSRQVINKLQVVAQITKQKDRCKTRDHEEKM